MEPAFEQNLEIVCAEKDKIDISSLSEKDLNEMKVKDLKEILEQNQVPYSDCVEKHDLVARILQKLK